MITTIAVIALGGALGALARYGVAIGTAHTIGVGFPWSTIIVNVMGSFLMGILIAKFATMEPVPQEIRHLCMTGFLGAFTTFSTFSLDFVTLWERGDMLQAFSYMAASVMLSILALFLALWIMRGMAS